MGNRNNDLATNDVLTSAVREVLSLFKMSCPVMVLSARAVDVNTRTLARAAEWKAGDEVVVVLVDAESEARSTDLDIVMVGRRTSLIDILHDLSLLCERSRHVLNSAPLRKLLKDCLYFIAHELQPFALTVRLEGSISGPTERESDARRILRAYTKPAAQWASGVAARLLGWSNDPQIISLSEEIAERSRSVAMIDPAPSRADWPGAVALARELGKKSVELAALLGGERMGGQFD